MATLLLGFALAVCLVFLPQLRFEDDISKSFLSDSSHYEDYTELISTLGFFPRQVVVLAESSNPFGLPEYESLRELALEFELADAVSSVVSVASARFPANHAQFPDAPVLPVVLNVIEIEKRLKDLNEAEFIVPVSADRRSALFVVSLTGGVSEQSFPSVVGQLRAVAQQFAGTNLQFSFTGEDLVGPEMIGALQSDLVINTLVGSGLAFVLALLMFGHLNLVLIAVLPALTATLFSIATFTILDYPVTVLSTVIPILIIVLGLADSVHLTLKFRDGDPELPVRMRARNAVVTVGPACALTSITTAVAFAAIGTSGNRQLKEFAVVGSVSVLLTYVAVIVCFALLACFLGRRKPRFKQRTPLDISTRWAGWVLDNSKRIYIVSAGIGIVTVIGLTGVHPWFNLDENLPTSSVVRITNQKTAKAFGGIYRIWSEIDVSGENAIDTEAGWKRLVALTEAIETAAPEYPVASLATLSRWRGQPDRVLSDEQLDNLPTEFLAQLHSKADGIARVITIAPEAMLDDTTLEIQRRIEQSAVNSGATRNVGLPIIMRHESVSVIRQLGIGLGIACLISVVIVAGFNAWPMLALVLVVPNALPIAVAAASLALTHNGELTPTAMLALTVAFGIAIDDSIHFVNGYLAEFRNGASVQQALQLSIQKTGRAMLMTTVLICTGLMVTMLSSFETIRLFGGMLILTFVTAFLADILLLPCLMRAIAREPRSSGL